jgi:endogenous inhibitor of DNA gyrase (YacG/DUF329 family)
MVYRCPICKKKVKHPNKNHIEQAKFFPFCSERCKLVDLGAWFDADYKVYTPLQSSKPTDDASD